MHAKQFLKSQVQGISFAWIASSSCSCQRSSQWTQAGLLLKPNYKWPCSSHTPFMHVPLCKTY